MNVPLTTEITTLNDAIKRCFGVLGQVWGQCKSCAVWRNIKGTLRRYPY